MTRILAAIDASAYAGSVCDHAAWFATRTGGPVELLHVIDRDEGARARLDLTGNIGLGARSALLAELTAADEARAHIAQEHGRVLLTEGRKRLQEAGVGQVTEAHRNGELAESLLEIEPKFDLVVMGKRGESGNYSPGHLGSKVERVLRASIRPVLIVPRVYMPISRTVVAFDGGSSAVKALKHVIEGAAFIAIPCLVVIVSNNSRQATQLGDTARDMINGHPSAAVIVLNGEVEAGISGQLRHGAGDLLVMGAYGHSRIRELIIGSTTTMMIRSTKVPVLLFR
jgi:nucleotide-binding universal stress UspA family protein